MGRTYFQCAYVHFVILSDDGPGVLLALSSLFPGTQLKVTAELSDPNFTRLPAPPGSTLQGALAEMWATAGLRMDVAATSHILLIY